MNKKLEEGFCVDAETKAELLEIEMRLGEKVSQSIKNGFDSMKSIIQELFNKDIEHLQDKNKKFEKYHEDHYNNKDLLIKAVSDMHIKVTSETDSKIEPLNNKIQELEKRQTMDEGQASGKDKAEESFMKKNGANIAIISIVISVLIAVLPNIL